jgi:hypothetical protein
VPKFSDEQYSGRLDRLRRILGGAAPPAEAPARPDRPQGEAAGGALLARSLPASRHMNNLLVALGPEKAFTQSGRIFERNLARRHVARAI